MERENEYLHSWYVFIITAFSLLFLLINNILWINILMATGALYIFSRNGLHLSKMFKILSYSFFFSAGIFLLTTLNPAQADRAGAEYRIFKFVFYETSLAKAFATMMKLFFVSFVSIASASAIDYTKVILHLIVHRGLKLTWGYPLLLAMNSIALFKDEYDRIKLNAQLRDLPFKDRVFLFFPLLVFAIRHSQRGALSLVTRGLNDKKTFYFKYDLFPSDKKRLLLFGVFYFGLVMMTQIKLR